MAPYRRSFIKRHLVRSFSALSARRKWQIVEERHHTDAERRAGKLWPMFAHTMIGQLRLDLTSACKLRTKPRENRLSSQEPDRTSVSSLRTGVIRYTGAWKR
jgi:hypothetical protein